jgi:hypothetical protein
LSRIMRAICPVVFDRRSFVATAALASELSRLSASAVPAAADEAKKPRRLTDATLPHPAGEALNAGPQYSSKIF